MGDLLNLINQGKSDFELAINYISDDDVLRLKLFFSKTTCTITIDSELPNSPKENLLTHAINRNADNCVMYLVHKLYWSVVDNMDTIFCPLKLCLIQCFIPVCYQLFRTTNIDF